MLVRKLGQRLLNTKIVMYGGGGHAPYDWRDDPTKNLDLETDARMIGVKSPT